jgi:hypothetical protein
VKYERRMREGREEREKDERRMREEERRMREEGDQSPNSVALWAE